jgi:hypothetical protein
MNSHGTIVGQYWDNKDDGYQGFVRAADGGLSVLLRQEGLCREPQADFPPLSQGTCE